MNQYIYIYTHTHIYGEAIIHLGVENMEAAPDQFVWAKCVICGTCGRLRPLDTVTTMVATSIATCPIWTTNHHLHHLWPPLEKLDLLDDAAYWSSVICNTRARLIIDNLWSCSDESTVIVYPDIPADLSWQPCGLRLQPARAGASISTDGAHWAPISAGSARVLT
jgi:hypothetical protein